MFHANYKIFTFKLHACYFGNKWCITDYHVKIQQKDEFEMNIPVEITLETLDFVENKLGGYQ